MNTRFPVDDAMAAHPGPPRATLLPLHQLAAWVNEAKALHDLPTAAHLVHQVLVAEAAVAVFALVPGQGIVQLDDTAAAPPEPGRRMRSYGLSGGPVVAGPAPAAGPSQRRAAIDSGHFEHLAVRRADAARLFGWQDDSAPVAQPVPPGAVADAAPVDWTVERLRNRKRQLEAEHHRAPLKQLSAESGIPERTIQHRLKQAQQPTGGALSAVAGQLIKAGKRPR